MKEKPVVLVTGAAKRIGQSIASVLHHHGFNVVIHYNQSEKQAIEFMTILNERRENSAHIVACNLKNTSEFDELLKKVYGFWGQINLLINNASIFYPTPIENIHIDQWEDLMDVNLKAPFFLSQKAFKYLKTNQGQIINIIDVHSERPLRNYPIYTIAKAGLKMLTESLAKEMGPKVRVNGVSPGIIMWADNELSCHEMKKELINRTALKRSGHLSDVAKAVLFLAQQGHYITGEIIRVDGGRHLQQ